MQDACMGTKVCKATFGGKRKVVTVYSALLVGQLATLQWIPKLQVEIYFSVKRWDRQQPLQSRFARGVINQSQRPGQDAGTIRLSDAPENALSSEDTLDHEAHYFASSR